MNFKRHITSELLKWKKSTDRKPLILRGARQVGKTTLINQFSQTYKRKIILNLELPKDIWYFNEFDDVSKLLQALFIAYNIPNSDRTNTLIFIDEIQESPEAIALLRYFYEVEPDVHVIAAGSLLEHAMRKVRSFPVGRVQMLYLYPLNFVEFLDALKHEKAVEELQKIPINQLAHNTLLDLFHQFTIIGGMPEVVKKYVETKNVVDLIPIYESIWETYKNDVAKYGSNDSQVRIIRHILATAYLDVDVRIKLNNFGNSNYKSREVGEAFKNLDDAKLIQLIYATTDLHVPVRADLRKSPRLQFLDTGLINNELNIQSEMLAMKDLSGAYRGAIVPHMIAQELISLNKTKHNKPNFWVRKKKQSSAEVDLVIVNEKMVIPVEIKAGKIGKLKSLHQFIEAADHPYAIRMYAGEFKVETHQTATGKNYFLMNLPYFLGTQLHEYIDYFVKNY